MGDYSEEKESQQAAELLKKDTLHVAPRNGPTRRIDIAPEIDIHQSKRYDELAGHSRGLDKKKKYLIEQALEKERIFKENVSNLQTRIVEFQKKIDQEIEERDESLQVTKEKFQNLFRLAEEEVEDELEASINVVQNDWLPKPAKRLDDWKDDFDLFVNVTVPTTVENQSGAVTRHLIKAQETFEIDNAKLIKRERRIVERFEVHKKNARANMREVEKKRKDCFLVFEEELYSEERASDRAEEVHIQDTYKRIKETQDMQSGLAGIRAETDSEILVAIEQTMSRLQKTVLDNFGVHASFK